MDAITNVATFRTATTPQKNAQIAEKDFSVRAK